MGAGTWYALEGQKVNDYRKWVFFGFVDLGNPDFAEYGEFALSELEGIELHNRWGLGIERDRHFSGTHKYLKEKYNLQNDMQKLLFLFLFFLRIEFY